MMFTKVLCAVLYHQILSVNTQELGSLRTLYNLNSYPDMQAAFVDHHNALRTSSRAGDMQQMVWDSNLANLAADWASRCTVAHRPTDLRLNAAGFAYVGESTWWIQSFNMPDPKRVIQDFFDEWQYYDYNSGGCTAEHCGHYTQVAWAKTCAVGCAISMCDRLTSSNIPWGAFVICDYGPGGNYPGQHPFTYGAACSMCPTGRCAGNGLCESQCTASGQVAVAQPVQTVAAVQTVTTQVAAQPVVTIATGPCIDVSTYCPYWNGIGECQRNPTYMLVNCQKSCNVGCGGATAAAAVCADSNSQCPYWAGIGECAKNPTYMQGSCRQSCGQCGTAAVQPVAQPVQVVANPNCLDTEHSGLCEFWKSQNECQKNVNFMMQRCTKTCTGCNGGSVTPCNNERSECGFWASSGQCQSNRYYMQWKCRQACGLC